MKAWDACFFCSHAQVDFQEHVLIEMHKKLFGVARSGSDVSCNQACMKDMSDSRVRSVVSCRFAQSKAK
jgi:hypothetical protein